MHVYVIAVILNCGWGHTWFNVAEVSYTMEHAQQLKTLLDKKKTFLNDEGVACSVESSAVITTTLVQR